MVCGQEMSQLSKIPVIFGSHLGNGGHIVKLRDGSIAYFIQ